MSRSLSVLLLAGLACSRPPAIEDIHRDGYRELQRGDLQAAQALAEEGTRQARAQGQLAWEWTFQVLEAEVSLSQRRNADALARLETGMRTAAVGAVDGTQVRALMTRGLARCLLGGNDQAFQQAESDLAAADVKANGLASAELIGEVALRRGTCRIVQADPKGAVDLFRTVLALSRRKGLRLLEAQAAGSLGVVAARAERYADAIDWLERAMALASQLKADNLVVKNMQNVGWCYLKLGDYERALPMLERAESLAGARGLAGDRQLALTNIGTVLYQRKDYAGARAHCLRALDVAQDLGDKRAIAQLQGNLGVVALDQGRYVEASAHMREALRTNDELNDVAGRQHSLLTQAQICAGRGDLVKAETMHRAVIASPHTEPELLWLTRASLADLLVSAGRSSEAEAEFRRAFALMERSRGALREAEHKISFFSRLRQFHENYVDFLVDAGRGPEALDVADQGRALLLQERSHSENREASRPNNFRKLARALDAVLLCYWTAPRRSFVWVISAEKVELRTLPGADTLRQEVEEYQSVILRSRDPLDENTPAGSWLYSTLIPPTLSALPTGARVVVVPDGPLLQINFDTLMVPGERPHFWIEDVTLATAPALGLLTAEASQRGPRPTSLLAIGAPLAPSGEFPVLPHAARELANIGALFDATDRVLYSGAEADPSIYRRADPGRFAYIHFAAHVTANREIPLDSAVVLSMRDDAYKLYAREIAAVPLQAEVVTLSACRSAGSRTFAGEGLVGLAWAFMSAGAANVIGGLWNVEDSSTSELMEEVYRGLKGGLDPPAALRAAKLRLLHSSTAYRKPFYWAPFALYTRRRAPRTPSAALGTSRHTSPEGRPGSRVGPPAGD